MKIKNKKLSVHDFIIFLKAKIAIILLATLLLSAIATYVQVDYRQHWEVKISRTVNRDAVMEIIIFAKNKSISNSQTYDFKGVNLNPITLMQDTNIFVNSAMVNYLSNQGIEYNNIKITDNIEDVFKKQKYKLIISGKKIINEDLLTKKLNSFFLDIRRSSNQIIKIQYDLDQGYDFKIYNFEVNDITNMTGYDYTKIFKIITINFVVSIFLLFIFHIRKFIRIF